MTERAAITDADRELLIDLLGHELETGHTTLEDVKSGKRDEWWQLQALAAHRIRARKEAIEEGFRAGCAAFEGKSHWASVDDLWEAYKDEL